MRHLPFLIALAICAYTFVQKSPPTPAVTGPVATALRSAPSSDRAYLASIYSALADVVTRDKGQRITTTAVWRAIHQDALRLAVGGTALKGKYPGLDVAVEEVLSQHYSLDDTAVGPEMAEQIAAGCRDVEAQCRKN